jgi:hypothetical protein
LELFLGNELDDAAGACFLFGIIVLKGWLLKWKRAGDECSGPKRAGECSGWHRGNFMQTVGERKKNVTLPRVEEFFDFSEAVLHHVDRSYVRTTQLSLFQFILCASSFFLSVKVSRSTYLIGAQF